ncbi:MAG TPA: serine/threonine-protein kinase, partial [Pyrinomonadaceae bacterium]|nr:serine/threonine-protein kinase [Pyrinomonadaceae bacterium]
MQQRIAHFRVIGPLGSGSSGAVWKAQDLALKRIVAIKLLHVPDCQATERIKSEAQMAATLNHPNIATVYELAEVDSRCYLVIEYVEGQTLKEKIEHGPLDLNASLAISTQVADALKIAHGRGLLHCDIKSSNIMITPEGLVKVLDFGLARPVSNTGLDPSLNYAVAQSDRDASNHSDLHAGLNRHKLAGTPGYMSPEQIRCDSLDGRTDIFSLGVVLYEMLTARLPFNGERRLDALHSTLVAELSPLSSYRDDVPLELEGIVRKALAKDRNQRYANLEGLLADLRSLKERFEYRGSMEGIPVGGDGDNSAAATRDEISTFRDVTVWLRVLAWRWRRWLLTGSILAAVIGIWNVLTLQPRGIEWATATRFLMIAALFAAAYAVGRKRAPAAVHAMATGAAFRG